MEIVRRFLRKLKIKLPHDPAILLLGCCCCSVAQSCLTLCDPMYCSPPGLPVPYHLTEFAQVHVRPTISSSVAYFCFSAFNLSQHQRLFQWVSCLHQVAKVFIHTCIKQITENLQRKEKPCLLWNKDSRLLVDSMRRKDEKGESGCHRLNDPDAGKDWRWEGKGTRQWDGWMASLTQWTWVWVGSRSC